MEPTVRVHRRDLLVREMDLDFVAYCSDCRLRGHVLLEIDRLSDLLNGTGTYTVRSVVAQSLDDGHAVALEEIEISADELCAVQAMGPRGNPGRRVRTRTHRMQLKVGPYLVAGDLHALPGTDPLSSIIRRGRFVALTGATLTYQRAGVGVLDDVEIVLVNRDLVEWIQPASNEAVAFPNIPIKIDAHAKDLTWDL